MLGSAIDITNASGTLSNFAFQMPRAGIITAFSAYFSTTAALSLIGPRDCVLYNFDQVQAVTGYYLPETVERYLWRGEGEKLIQEITSPCGTVEDAEEIRKMLAKTRTEGTENSVWFIGSFNSREDITAEWRAAGLEVEELGSFFAGTVLV